MRRAVLALAFFLAACGSSSTSAPPPSTLQIAIQPGFIANAKPRHYTLTCSPDGGTLPNPTAACAALGKDPHLLAAGAACPVGMPDVGSKAVTGSWQGKPVSLSYRGCDGDNARWVAMAKALGLIP
jgi:hypothetical protein